MKKNILTKNIVKEAIALLVAFLLLLVPFIVLGAIASTMYGYKDWFFAALGEGAGIIAWWIVGGIELKMMMTIARWLMSRFSKKEITAEA